MHRRLLPLIASLLLCAACSAADFGAAAVPNHAVAPLNQSASRVASDTVVASDALSAKASSRWKVCGRASLLRGPSRKPRGAKRVKPSQSLPAVVNRSRAGTTFWLKRGVYHLGSGIYDQVIPKNNDTFIGAPGAVIDGQHKNLYAFTQHASRVTIKYLTIRNFGAAGDNQDQGVVNHDSATGWHIVHDKIAHDAGAGVMIGTRDVLRYDCLEDNGQYGFNAYSPTGPRHVTLDHNEIAGNDTYNFDGRNPGCGCVGGGKFWKVDGATITNNYIHSNIGPGLWADTNNRGFNIQDNLISYNTGEGLIYEISYNANISHNRFVHNAAFDGPTNPGFPTGAIYISESGADRRVSSAFNKRLTITHNSFTNNWAGVVLWENANRFCNSPDNSSSGVCTLVDPKVAKLGTCVPGLIEKAPYFEDCRWRTQNVLVAHNRFTFTRSAVGHGCSTNNGCGLNAIFSNYGTDPTWSPYQGTVVENHITFDQHNKFADNTYVGAWRFMAHDQGHILKHKAWRSKPYLQDAGSTFH